LEKDVSAQTLRLKSWTMRLRARNTIMGWAAAGDRSLCCHLHHHLHQSFRQHIHGHIDRHMDGQMNRSLHRCLHQTLHQRRVSLRQAARAPPPKRHRRLRNSRRALPKAREARHCDLLTSMVRISPSKSARIRARSVTHSAVAPDGHEARD
jgi:hypothetical protein